MPTEIWKDIPGYEDLYQASNFGRVKSLRRNIIMLPRADKHGYLRVMLSVKGYRKYCQIHRLVAWAFIPNPENKPVVNHIDGDPRNNKVDNLEWCTQSENVLHAIHNLNRLGHSFPSKKIRCVETGEVFVSMTRAAKTYNSNPGNIWRSATSGRYRAGGYHWAFV